MLTTQTLPLNSTIGVTGTLNGDALYMVQITDNGTNISGSNLTQIATGLRNAAGLAFHPVTDALYFEDNGMDTPGNLNEPFSADELNVITAGNIGGAIENYGFPSTYEDYRTTTTVGGSGTAPLVAFRPIPDPATGAESEGPNDITFAPPGFPTGLNDGVFVGFHGKFSSSGTSNEENPLVYVDLNTGDYFHFIGVNETNVGHLNGLLSAQDDLFVADMSPGGGFGSSAENTGVIYRIHSKTLLPVELISFEAIADADAVVLSWRTVSDANNAGFEIQHSTFAAANVENVGVTLASPAGWHSVAFVEGHGTTEQPQTYLHRVDGLAPGRHRFRLKQIDFDGTVEYSPEVDVFFELPDAFLVTRPYPNPFNPETHFSLMVKRRQQVEVAVSDGLGRHVQTLYQGKLEAEQARAFVFEAGTLPSGMYVIRVVGEAFVVTRPVTLVR